MAAWLLASNNENNTVKMLLRFMVSSLFSLFGQPWAQNHYRRFLG